MRAIALANQKGGVGKTTSTANLGASLALLGKRTLMIDVDPQANLTTHYGIDLSDGDRSLYDLLSGEAAFGEVVRSTQVEGLDIVPSHIDLAGAEIELVGMVGRETVLKEAVADAVGAYEFVLADCPPSLGLLTLNAMTTVSEVFIPIQTEFFALQGMSKLIETVEIVRRRLNPALRVRGVVACQFDPRTNLSSEVLGNIQKHFPEWLFRTVIRRNVTLAESPSHGEPISRYAEGSRGNADYMALAREVIEMEG